MVHKMCNCFSSSLEAAFFANESGGYEWARACGRRGKTEGARGCLMLPQDTLNQAAVISDKQHANLSSIFSYSILICTKGHNLRQKTLVLIQESILYKQYFQHWPTSYIITTSLRLLHGLS